MTTLITTIDAKRRKLALSDPPAVNPGGLIQVGTEYMEVSGVIHERATVVTPERHGLVVRRGALGTVAGAHDAGATVAVVRGQVQTNPPVAPPVAQGDLGESGPTTTPALAAVLAEGNDADGIPITNLGAPSDPSDAARLQDVGGGSLDAIVVASAGQDIADALAGATAPSAGNPFATRAEAGGAVNWVGAWDSGTTYQPGDGVTHDGSLWVALAESTDDEPPSAAWLELPVAPAGGGAVNPQPTLADFGLDNPPAWQAETSFLIPGVSIDGWYAPAVYQLDGWVLAAEDYGGSGNLTGAVAPDLTGKGVGDAVTDGDYTAYILAAIGDWPPTPATWETDTDYGLVPVDTVWTLSDLPGEGTFSVTYQAIGDIEYEVTGIPHDVTAEELQGALSDGAYPGTPSADYFTVVGDVGGPFVITFIDSYAQGGTMSAVGATIEHSEAVEARLFVWPTTPDGSLWGPYPGYPLGGTRSTTEPEFWAGEVGRVEDPATGGYWMLWSPSPLPLPPFAVYNLTAADVPDGTATTMVMTLTAGTPLIDLTDPTRLLTRGVYAASAVIRASTPFTASGYGQVVLYLGAQANTAAGAMYQYFTYAREASPSVTSRGGAGDQVSVTVTNNDGAEARSFVGTLFLQKLS